jgi:hypothetical protein
MTLKSFAHDAIDGTGVQVVGAASLNAIGRSNSGTSDCINLGRMREGFWHHERFAFLPNVRVLPRRVRCAAS